MRTDDAPRIFRLRANLKSQTFFVQKQSGGKENSDHVAERQQNPLCCREGILQQVAYHRPFPWSTTRRVSGRGCWLTCRVKMAVEVAAMGQERVRSRPLPEAPASEARLRLLSSGTTRAEVGCDVVSCFTEIFPASQLRSRACESSLSRERRDYSRKITGPVYLAFCLSAILVTSYPT